MRTAAMHSWVDTAAECFRLAAYFAARRPADEEHPLGYGRDSYVWSLFASIAMVIVGAEVGVWLARLQTAIVDLREAKVDNRRRSTGDER